ncbi:6-phospho-3-hexuloisomerase [Salinibacillus xinjiangensis]|uniref:6-phospho-3-hexuloisomerase n=1 Tax=Salinibacillus xinjiangensis TaxID=1229268 RepID=A0A6G1X1V5_9BACI|nr:6-phospho-3-hexuloisomerase [Salinibacillus xinjiangensis]MRG84963.1 6-phospho-3-hexuloisomerase [Salinibacillus xinjiangensis]
MKNVHLKILEELKQVAEHVDNEQVTSLIDALKQAKHIFICGEGRSGLIGKAFAMRLMHANYPVYVTGETITPSIQEGDLLVAISGSGNTPSVALVAEQAAKNKAKVYLVTTNSESDIGDLANHQVIIPAATKHRRKDEPETIQPMGNQFDQSVHLLLDAVVISMTSKQEDIHDMMKRNHANLQ